MAGAASAQRLDGVIDGQTVHVESEPGGQWLLAGQGPASTDSRGDAVSLEPTVADFGTAAGADPIEAERVDGRGCDEVELADGALRGDAERGTKREPHHRLPVAGRRGTARRSARIVAGDRRDGAGHVHRRTDVLHGEAERELL